MVQEQKRELILHRLRSKTKILQLLLCFHAFFSWYLEKKDFTNQMFIKRSLGILVALTMRWLFSTTLVKWKRNLSPRSIIRGKHAQNFVSFFFFFLLVMSQVFWNLKVKPYFCSLHRLMLSFLLLVTEVVALFAVSTDNLLPFRLGWIFVFLSCSCRTAVSIFWYYA